MTGRWIAVGLPALVLLAGAVCVLLALRRGWIVVRVNGVSMLPTLRDGDVILARRAAGSQVTVGDIVIFERPALPPGAVRFVSPAPGAGTAAPRPRQWIIKRVVAVAGDPVPEAVALAMPAVSTVPQGCVLVLGDNGGLDSRIFGPLPYDRVLGAYRRPVTNSPGPSRVQG